MSSTLLASASSTSCTVILPQHLCLQTVHVYTVTLHLQIMLQVFEAMGEFVGEANFHKHALPRMVRIAAQLQRRCPGVPLMVFPRGAAYATDALQQVRCCFT